MRFTIELVVSTGDNERYRIAGFLEPDQGEEKLISEMISCLKNDLEDTVDFSHYLSFKENKIIYNDIPIVPCSNIFKLFKNSLKISIETVVVPRTKYIPEDCKPLFQMELNRLFN